MKLVIVSTTIRGEVGYLAFDRLAKLSSDFKISFVVAGDKKSRPFDTTRFSTPVEYLTPDDQGRYQCSERIGWNKIMRRNTALLRAIEMDPDLIMTIDDDNQPADDFFDVWYRTVTNPVNRLMGGDDSKARAEASWFNYLRHTDARIEIYPRGFPIVFRGQKPPEIKATTSIRPEQIGLYQGVSLGDCDIDAITRISYPAPVSALNDKNYCVRDIFSPYNTQNTVFRRPLFPVAFVWPFCGRYDDIYSSFVWQRLLFNQKRYVHVGDAVNRQVRGQRDILREMKDEVEGYLNAHHVWAAINTIEAQEPLAFLQSLLALNNEIIQRQGSFIEAFMEDLREIDRKMVKDRAGQAG